MSDTDMLYMASLEKRNAELEARIAELEDKHWNECRQIAHYSNEATQDINKWISVKDRLPEIGQPVLICIPKWEGEEIQAAKLESDGKMFEVCGEFYAGTWDVTHWMPLPEPPKDGDTNG